MSPIKAIVATADADTENFIGAIPLSSAILRANSKRIWLICRDMVARKTPVCPTADSVAERGGLTDNSFPSRQSIYNRYRTILSIWRKAYTAIMSAGYDSASTKSDIDYWEIKSLDSDLQAKILEMKSRLNSLVLMNNSLKQFIAETVPVYSNEKNIGGDLAPELLEWIDYISRKRFTVDDVGLRVSRHTMAQTIIMERSLFEKLQDLAAKTTERAAPLEPATIALRK